MSTGGSYCFVADVHLGRAGGSADSRERDFIAFLDSLGDDVRGLYLLGDIFDFWVEYPDEIPEGYSSVLQRFKKLTDRGCEVWFFRGNHDWWTLDYFERELGMHVCEDLYKIMDIGGKTFCIGHGDEPGCTYFKAKLIFKLFRNKALISILRKMPRGWIRRFGHKWSARRPRTDYRFDLPSSGIRRFAEQLGKERHIDYFVFGHYHKESSMRLDCGSMIYILGDWAQGPSYLNLSGTSI